MNTPPVSSKTTPLTPALIGNDAMSIMPSIDINDNINENGDDGNNAAETGESGDDLYYNLNEVGEMNQTQGQEAEDLEPETIGIC